MQVQPSSETDLNFECNRVKYLKLKELSALLLQSEPETHLEEFAEFLELLVQVTIEDYLIDPAFTTPHTNFSEVKHEFLTRMYETLCTSTIGDRVRKYLTCNPQIWHCLYQLYVRAEPLDETQKYKPQVTPEGMQRLLVAAQKGENVPMGEIIQDESNLDPEIFRIRRLFHSWGRMRRASLGVVRNLVQQSNFTEVRQIIGSNLDFIRALAMTPRNINEEGVIVAYCCTTLRFLLLPLSNSNQVTDWQRGVYEICLEPDICLFLIGTAVTNRLVKLPDGTRLWIHMEATRLVALITTICESVHLPKLLSALRAFCDAILATSHSSMHVDMGSAILRLIEDCPDVTRKLFTKDEDSPPTRPIKFLVEFNDRRLVESSLGMLILSTKEYLADQNNIKARESLFLSLRIIRWISDDLSKQLLENKAEEVLSVIGNVIPEALELLSYIKNVKPVEEQSQDSDHPHAHHHGFWSRFCTIL